MRRQILLCLFLIMSVRAFCQPTSEQCFYATRKGLVFTNNLLILRLDKTKFLMEYYTYGGGLFSGLPSVDTLLATTGKLRSNKYDVAIESKRIIIKSKEGKRKFKFKILNKCDSTINATRNWSVRETVRYKIKDRQKSDDFYEQTEPLLKSLCYR